MTEENDTPTIEGALADFQPAGPSYDMIVTMTTGSIVESYLQSNTLTARDALDVLPKLISGIQAAFFANGPAEAAAEEPPTEEAKTPAEIKRSITPDALISFIDGKSYKTLKRHLSTHGTDPAEYRRFYGLPADYPMVCANYSAARSALAKSLGLGQQGRRAPAAAAA